MSAWWEFITIALLASTVKPIIMYTATFYNDNYNLNAKARLAIKAGLVLNEISAI